MKQFYAALALALALGATPVIAKEAQDAAPAARVVPVSYSGLDLNQTGDAASMLSRLQNGAARACAVDEVRQQSAVLRRAIEQCREAALAEAVTRANSPELTRLYEAQR